MREGDLKNLPLGLPFRERSSGGDWFQSRDCPLLKTQTTHVWGQVWNDQALEHKLREAAEIHVGLKCDLFRNNEPITKEM